jgi:putative ABC transport system permease protein
VSQVVTGSEQQAQQAGLIGILISFLLLMAVLIAVVGGLGLMGTMSMNVLERTREIGVLRAIGASNRSILGMILLEGMLIGGLSWALGSALSLPIGAGLSAVAGTAFVTIPMPLVVSPIGFVIWLAVALVLSAVASLLPAWRAVRLTIREILAYE